MAGMIESMFPGWVATKEYYTKGEGRENLDSIARGVQSLGTAPVDLASYPVSWLTGMKREDMPLTTPWMDKKGFMAPDHPGFINDILELGAGMAMPARLGGAIVSKADEALGVGSKVIPVNRGQAERDINLMGDAAKLGNDRRFAQRVHEFNKKQNDIAGSVFDGFARSISKAGATDEQLGKRIQQNFEKWYDTVISNQKARTDKLYESALKHPAAKEALPESDRGLAIINDFVAENIGPKTPESVKASLMAIQEQAIEALKGPINLVDFDQHMKLANEAFKKSPTKVGVYDHIPGSILTKAEAKVKEALTARLDDAIAAGGPTGEAASNLKMANKVYSDVIESRKTLQNQKLSQFLKAKSDDVLTPQTIAEKFETLGRPEQKFFMAVANKMDPEMVDQTRRHLFEDLVTAGKTRGAADVESQFSIKQFLTRYDYLKDKKPAMFEFMMGDDPAVIGKFNELVQNAKQAISTGKATPDDKTGVRGVASGVVGMATGHAGTARTADATFGIMDNLFTNKDALYDHIFKGGPKPPEGVLGKGIDTAVRAARTVNPGMAYGAGAVGVSNIAEDDATKGPAEAPTQLSGPMPSAPPTQEIDPADLNWDQPASNESQIDPKDLNW